MAAGTETLKEALRARRHEGEMIEVAPDVACVPLSIVNAYLVGPRGAGDGGWVLVDAGLWFSASRILRDVAERFGTDSRPAAIILTHGHFDHVGALKQLAKLWDVPVYAHELELPYLTGRSSYPPPDPSVGGGAMALMSFMYPRGPINLGDRVRPLPATGEIPGMPGWRWIPTPGHTPGHVSLFRESDRCLIVGDAFVTTRQESMLCAMTQPMELNGPPAYFTPDWATAMHSVETLASLEPAIAATGHGRPMSGPTLREELHELALHFGELAVPAHGRYVHRPAVADSSGVISVPPAPVSTRTILTGAALGAGLVAGILWARSRRQQERYRLRGCVAD